MKFSVVELCKMCRREEIEEECTKCKFIHAKDMSQLRRYFMQKVGWVLCGDMTKL